MRIQSQNAQGTVRMMRLVRVCIEGFYEVRTPYALRPGRHVGFFWNNKICFNFVSILFEKIKLTVSERTYIIVPIVQLGFMKFKQQWVRPYL